MTVQQLSHFGYVCSPYLHNHESIKLKDHWLASDNIEALYFVTGTFSNESKLYFPNSTNHYIFGKFKDSQYIQEDLTKHNQEKTSFLFNIHDQLFERIFEKTNFISVYYLEIDETKDDYQDITNIFLKREKIGIAGLASLETFCNIPSKFTFPYAHNVVILEVAGEKNHQSVNNYCEQIKRDINRKGHMITNLINLSILETLK